MVAREHLRGASLSDALVKVDTGQSEMRLSFFILTILHRWMN